MFITGKYEIIYTDCPWAYDNNGEYIRKEYTFSGAGQYPRMKLSELKALNVKDIAAKDACLFMWGVYPQLPQVQPVMQAWGFQYVTVAFTWVKTNNGIGFPCGEGHWTLANPELLFLGRRGKVETATRGIHNLQFAPRLEHSEKPNLFRDLIVKLCGDLPRIELFARKRVKGWDAWGLEVPGGSDIEIGVNTESDTDWEDGDGN